MKPLIKTQRRLPSWHSLETSWRSLCARSQSQQARPRMPCCRCHSIVNTAAPAGCGKLLKWPHICMRLMGFYCVVLEQIKKRYLLIWGRTKKRSASGTNTTPLSHTLKHSFEFSTLSVFEMAFPEIVIDCLIGCLRVPSNCFSALFQVCVRRE